MFAGTALAVGMLGALAISATGTASTQATITPSVADSSSAPGAIEERAQHPDRERRAGEHHGAAGARDRLLDRLLDAGPGRQLLAEPGDDQQRVVDAEREADHREHVQRQRVEREPVVEERHHGRPDAGHEQAAERAG